MKTSLKTALTILISGCIYISAHTQTLHVYTGLLHAHTMISDGSGTPEEAYAMARQNHIDFFAITPHNHSDAEDGAKAERRDGVMIATNPLLYNGPSDVTVTRKWKENNVEKTETVTLKPLLKAASAATNQHFVALYGQEFSTISSGNHMNVIGIDELITVDNGNFSGLIELLERIRSEGKPLPILQLNHPDVHADLFYKGDLTSEKKKMFNDYGIDPVDLGPDFRDMVRALDPYLSLIEVLSGPAMEKQPVSNFRYDDHENDYFFYLKQGFHLSPSAGQDNHYKTWGTVTDARTGVWATGLTQDALFDAFRKHRTFASEDKNLHLQYFVNDSIMGSFIHAPEESELNIRINIEDADELHAAYKIFVYGGNIHSELSTEATDWKAADGLLGEMDATGNGTFSINDIIVTAQPSFLYLKVQQNDGDRLWTSPVWINDTASISIPHPEAIFFWTKSPSSHVYHQKGCSAIDRIKPENLMQGTVPPAGRTLHNCSISEEDEP